MKNTPEWHADSTKLTFGKKLLARLIYYYLKCVFLTCSWKRIGYERHLKHHPSIICFWHGRLAMIPCFRPHDGIDLWGVVSRHDDGQFIAEVIRLFKLRLIHGSSKKASSNKERGGASVIRQTLMALRRSERVALIPDGPRGPHQHVKGEVALLAAHSGAPILPVAYSVSRGKILKSWDHFLLPYPFAKGALVCAKPLLIESDASEDALAEANRKLEDALNYATRKADRLVGRTITKH